MKPLTQWTVQRDDLDEKITLIIAAQDRATPEMDMAGEAALTAGAQDATSLAHKVWLATAGLRSGQRQ